jgi:hypothetical protein
MNIENEPMAKTKKELALKYLSKATPETATRILRRWIAEDEELQNALKAVNYRKNSHWLTPLHVETIYKFLGKP